MDRGLRRGLATTARCDGGHHATGRWKQVHTVMEYIEAANRFETNAAGQVLTKDGGATNPVRANIEHLMNKWPLSQLR